MTNQHRFILEPYKTPKSRYSCPRCQHRNKTFTRYIDTLTSTYLADHVGKCDRLDSCGYHYTPREYFKAEPFNRPANTFKPLPPPRPKPHSVLPPGLIQQSCTHYERNNFAWFLGRMFEPDICHELTEMYHIGTSNHWKGACVFWQIDVKGKVRTGKVMLYNAQDGKRVKEPYNHIAWVHRLLSKKSKLKSQNSSDIGFLTSDFILKQCFFGEHLLNYTSRSGDAQPPVAIVESEKTAIIAAGFMPQYTWLAAGSLEGLNADKCKALKGRKVILFPDANGYDKWQAKADVLRTKMPAINFRISRYLLEHASPAQLLKGIDIADMFIPQTLQTP